MSTHYIDCDTCGMELGSSHDGYEDGVHPECKIFTKARVLALDTEGDLTYESKTPTEVWDDVMERREIIVFDLTEPKSIAFTEGSYPKGDL